MAALLVTAGALIALATPAHAAPSPPPIRVATAWVTDVAWTDPTSRFLQPSPPPIRTVRW